MSDRLLAALAAYRAASAVTVIGPGVTDPLVAYGAHFPGAVFTLFEPDPRAAAQLARHTPERFRVVTRAAAAPLPPAQVAIIRHPDVHRLWATWVGAFDAAVRSLLAHGVLAITCYSWAEAQRVRNWFLNEALELHLFGPEHLTPVEFSGADRYILLHNT
ncbi:MAG: hypothetical protein GYB64_00680 [Chloroflexi bacterium]|nr:hypothetical protein [Chloroflexota bacterium]